MSGRNRLSRTVRRRVAALAGRALGLLALGLSACIVGLSPPALARDLLVFAAASQRDALESVMAAWAKLGEGTAKASYESSSILARPIAKGAPPGSYLRAPGAWWEYRAGRP